MRLMKLATTEHSLKWESVNEIYILSLSISHKRLVIQYEISLEYGRVRLFNKFPRLK